MYLDKTPETTFLIPSYYYFLCGFVCEVDRVRDSAVAKSMTIRMWHNPWIGSVTLVHISLMLVHTYMLCVCIVRTHIMFACAAVAASIILAYENPTWVFWTVSTILVFAELPLHVF